MTNLGDLGTLSVSGDEQQHPKIGIVLSSEARQSFTQCRRREMNHHHGHDGRNGRVEAVHGAARLVQRSGLPPGAITGNLSQVSDDASSGPILPGLDLTRCRIPRPDEVVARCATMASDALYVSVGLGILSFQNAQVRRRELTRSFERWVGRR